jgi:RHS repeat-associated protein
LVVPLSIPVWSLDISESSQGAGGVGGLISVVVTGEAYQFLYDANGNVGQLVKSSDGTIAAHYEYDPFEVLLKSSGSMANENPFRFSTKYYDTETDLYYYGYRYYSAQLGRWINRDPIEEEGGFNLYGFVENDPIDYIDPIGEDIFIMPGKYRNNNE